ncbi:hypothetical protein LUCX_301 [Xanthomonas phage vB_XciM_LucasX]|nr:hypothetical protein LUCX_301 [Xanthomonas phage vB_XciM_LucasX]
MGNPAPTDRRFDKPTHESLIDLINYSNKSYIGYDEIEADQITPVNGGSVSINTSVRIRLKGAAENAPYAIMRYARLDLSEYIPNPEDFRFDSMVDADSVFAQLKALHHIQLSELDCAVVIGEILSDGTREITFLPFAGHPVWIGELTVKGVPTNHLANTMAEGDLDGFTLAQLAYQ